MKTVFKVGMEVWDKTISPKRGKVIEVFTDYKYDFPIKVEFENNVKVQYTTEGCFVKNEGAVPTLSTTDYSVEMKGFEQKALVPTFEDVWDNKKEVYTSPYYDENYSGYASEELADAAEAFRKLLFLRDYYNEGWEPDWTDGDEYKYCIKNFGNELYTIDLDFSARVMTFKTLEIRDKFLEEQKELLEIAKPLL